MEKKFCRVGMIFRSLLAAIFVIVLSGTFCMSLHAQTVRIKLVNGKNGNPMADKCVNVRVGTERKGVMAIPTDKDGVAWLHLTDKDAEVNIQNYRKGCGYFGVINPVVKYADSMRINAGFVLCQPHGSSYSWLAFMTFSTQKVLQSGVVTPNVCGKAMASPEPGEVIIFVRPLTFWEKLKT
jgi:hypothetical protein